ncbi:HCL441Wp [Eremothecium sinecaudum]|uniref:HCL441Wp n=1 Tax=Eremothecium sinecaudum TaxID=45286 RepID=A0A120K1S8_9SACH|nr:HCL441Wp [Eremothecium sinecaudum]AMD19710.1 HCL441Wp [Eremothecium sinecaudum]
MVNADGPVNSSVKSIKSENLLGDPSPDSGFVGNFNNTDSASRQGLYGNQSESNGYNHSYGIGGQQESNRGIGSSVEGERSKSNSPGPDTGLKNPAARKLNEPINYGSISSYGINENNENGEGIDDSVYLRDDEYDDRRKYKRFMRDWRLLMVILVVISSVWLVAAFISDYLFNISFMNYNRTAGFEDIALIFISMIANIMTYLLSRIGQYSKVEQYANMILCGLTLLNLFIAVCTRYTRTRMGKVGVMTYLWVAFSFAVSALFEWYLYTFKNYSDRERHTNKGRSAWKTTTAALKDWSFAGAQNMIKLVLMGYLLLFTLNNFLHAVDLHRARNLINSMQASATSDNWSALHWANEDHTYQLHIRCYGDVYANSSESGRQLKPIVLYEHGGADTGYLSMKWIQDLYSMNRIDRYCTYDRPGYGLSDAPPAPISIGLTAEGLKYALLKEANITGPFIAVGYDMGGLVTQVFTAKNTDLVKGMMLIESWHENMLLNSHFMSPIPGDYYDPDFRPKIPSEIRKPYRVSTWWRGILSTIGLKLQTSWLIAHRGSRERLLGRDMIYQGKYLRTKFLEAITNPVLSFNDVVNSHERLTHIPTSVVTSRDMIKKNKMWGQWQRELTRISGKTEEWKVAEGGHELYKYELGQKALKEVLLRLVDSADEQDMLQDTTS